MGGCEDDIRPDEGATAEIGAHNEGDLEASPRNGLSDSIDNPVLVLQTAVRIADQTALVGAHKEHKESQE